MKSGLSLFQTAVSGLRTAASRPRFLLLLALVACTPPAAEETRADEPEASASEPATAATLRYAANLNVGELRTTARRLAGLDVEGAVAEAPWQRHAELLDASWRELEARHLGPMRSWAQAELDVGEPTAPLFYPFGGPDLLSALQFFPEASSYVLVGLEPPGKIPDLEGLEGPSLDAELTRLRDGLDNLVTEGYFVTTQMERDFAPAEPRLDGFLPVLYLFLARADFSPVAVRYLALDDNGEVHHPEMVRDDDARAVRIDFVVDGEEDGASVRSVYYFSQDLSDAGLAAAPGFGAWLRQLGFNAYMKSASYLLHMPEFVDCRELLLAEARTILQDDSGVPLRSFDRQRFDVRFFGTYTETLPTYRQWFQVDLRTAFAAQEREPLPFAIGYNRRITGSGLIWAERQGRAE